jgi:DNA-binding MarR family transcriptional regulator
MAEEMIPNERERIAAIPSTCVNNHLRRAARVINAFYDDKVRASGLYANQVMMLLPPYLQGPININKMAERIGLDRTTLVRNLKPLEQRGFVTVKPGQDLRMRIVELTPKGREVLVAAVPLWEEAQQQIIELLGPKHSQLMGILSSLVAPEHIT